MNGAPLVESHVTTTMTQYLLAMHCVRREGQPLIGARLAEWLGVAPASVTGMLQRMSRGGLVQMGRGKEIALTQAGWRIAMTTARRHYLAERLLTDLIGVEWARAHTEAELWLHSITDATEDKLWVALGRPTTCPHGSPIPGTGACFSPHVLRLSEAEAGAEVLVESITERAAGNVALLEFFQRHGMTPGRALRLLEHSPEAGTTTVQSEQVAATIGADAAAQVLVVPAALYHERKAPTTLRRESVRHAEQH